MNKLVTLDKRSRDLRKTIINTMVAGGRGHLPSAFSVVEILRVLYDQKLNFQSDNPKWKHRDRFILSKGHGCLALYVLLAEKGFFPGEELDKFCKADGILGGHPEYQKIPGVEASTGSLGHGLSIGIGFAINAKYEKLNYQTYVVIGDGESNEGTTWEAALCASKHHLGNLTVLIDYNKQQSYDSTANILELEPLTDKWKSFGFATYEVDGHNTQQISSVLAEASQTTEKPKAIICHTIKGKGVSFMEGDLTWHHKSKLKGEEIKNLMSALEDEQ